MEIYVVVLFTAAFLYVANKVGEKDTYHIHLPAIR